MTLALVSVFLATMLWAVGATALHFVPTPGGVPIIDRGHFTFHVKDELAQIAVVHAINAATGLTELHTLDLGYTHQAVLSDNSMAIVWVEQPLLDSGLPVPCRSFTVSDPQEAARQLVSALELHGYKSVIHQGILPEVGDKFVLVTSDAFIGWCVAFRFHALKMGAVRPAATSRRGDQGGPARSSRPPSSDRRRAGQTKIHQSMVYFCIQILI